MGQDWRKTREYRIWRANVIRRDKVCTVCGSGQHRQAHHIEQGAYNTALRYDISNGVTLCRTCHTSFHIDYKKGFRKKGTGDDFARFIKITNLKRS
jgi:5-methylcytosine-specific restriction endonuclease McrA